MTGRDEQRPRTEQPAHEDPHSRPGHEDLPFGDDPQENQGDDPGSGGS